MRAVRLLPLLGFSVCGLACAQSDVSDAMRTVGQSTDLQISVNGGDSRPGGLPYAVDFFYHVDPKGKQLVEVDEYVNGATVPNRQTVGDGTTMWVYDRVKNSYTALRYGVYSGNEPATYAIDFFHALVASGNSRTSGGLRLLENIYGADGGANLKPWMVLDRSVGDSALDTTVGLTFGSNTDPYPDVTPNPNTKLPQVWGKVPHGNHVPGPYVMGYQDPIYRQFVYQPTQAGTNNVPPAVSFQTYFDPTLAHSMAYRIDESGPTLTDVYSAQAYRGGYVSWWQATLTQPIATMPTFTFVPPQGTRGTVSRVGG